MFERQIRIEQNKFNKLLPSLLKTRRKGQVVLFRDGKVVSYHKTVLKAYATGIKKFGVDSYFVIDRVESRTPLFMPGGWY